MYKITHTYTDYNGVERTEDFYFNLTKAELTEMQLTTNGGLDHYIERIIAAKDQKALIEIFKDLVIRAYGQKSADGRRFIKTDEVREDFMQTEAYSDIFMELATNADAASKFVNGIIPKSLAESAQNMEATDDNKELIEKFKKLENSRKSE